MDKLKVKAYRAHIFRKVTEKEEYQPAIVAYGTSDYLRNETHITVEKRYLYINFWLFELVFRWFSNVSKPV